MVISELNRKDHTKKSKIILDNKYATSGDKEHVDVRPVNVRDAGG